MMKRVMDFETFKINEVFMLSLIIIPILIKILSSLFLDWVSPHEKRDVYNFISKLKNIKGNRSHFSLKENNDEVDLVFVEEDNVKSNYIVKLNKKTRNLNILKGDGTDILNFLIKGKIEHHHGIHLTNKNYDDIINAINQYKETSVN